MQSRLGSDENKMYGTDQEKGLFKLSGAMRVGMAEEMSDEEIGISAIVATGTPTSVDFASLGTLLNLVVFNTQTDLFINRIFNQLYWRRRTASTSVQPLSIGPFTIINSRSMLQFLRKA